MKPKNKICLDIKKKPMRNTGNSIIICTLSVTKREFQTKGKTGFQSEHNALTKTEGKVNNVSERRMRVYGKQDFNLMRYCVTRRCQVSVENLTTPRNFTSTLMS